MAAPTPLINGAKQKLIYACDLERLPEDAGVYVFGRRFGKKFEALYVGKAKTIRKRVKTQLQNVKLMMHIKGAKNGRRILLAGRFRGAPGQQEAKCLLLIERAMIRYFLSEAHDLVNVQGARLRQHSILSEGAKRIIPAEMLLDRR